MLLDTDDINRALGVNDDWSEVWNQLRKRRLLLAELSKLDKDQSEFDLNAIDLFVEKAQIPLGRRGDQFQIFGTVLIALVALLVGFLIWRVLCIDVGAELTRIENSKQPILTFLFFAIQKLSLGGLVLGLAIYFAGQSRSYMHESLTAFGRRHSVRLGRLYLYLKLGGLPAEKLFEEKCNLDVEKFIAAFGGQKEATTAFKEIKSEDQLASNWFSTLINGVGSIPDMIRKMRVQHD